MSADSLSAVWEAASASPYQPLVGKNSQLTVGAVLLLISFLLSGVFAVNRSAVNLAALGIPASIAFGFGAVYMICAVGVYV